MLGGEPGPAGIADAAHLCSRDGPVVAWQQFIVAPGTQDVVEQGGDLLIRKLRKCRHDPVVGVTFDPDRTLHPEEEGVYKMGPSLGGLDEFGGVCRQRRKCPHPALPIFPMAERTILLVELWARLGQSQTQQHQEPRKFPHNPSIDPNLEIKVRNGPQKRIG